jgi:hypothetical protein
MSHHPILDIDDARRAIARHPLAISRYEGAQRAAAEAFGRLNGWALAKAHSYSLELLGRAIRTSGEGRDHLLLDHDYWFRKDRRYVAQREGLTKRGFVLHLLPDPFASFRYPGWTLFVVVTKPGVAVRWLPEQDGRLRGLSDWMADNASFHPYAENVRVLARASP